MERAKRLIAPTTIKAADLTAPPPPVTTPPPPVQGSIPTQTAGVVQNVAKDVTGLITAQTQEAQRARELAQEMSALGDQGSLSDMFSQERSRLGIDTNLQELKDIQLQLSDMDTGSKLTETRIEGAAGQTLAQGQREVTQEQRENAVRTSGLAARAAVLQGNINTATQLAKDTVNLAFQDRTLKAQNVLNQLNYYQGIVDDQTAQLIEQDKRQYEAEIAAIEELKTNISTAMVNGATQAEIGQLNDPNLDDASKLALAQSITARGANEMRGLDMEAQRASIAQTNASTANIYDQMASRRTALREAALTATSEQEAQQAKAVADTEQALEIKTLASELLQSSGLDAAVGFGVKKSLVGSLPFVSGDAIAGTSRADFEAQATRLSNLLTLDNLKLMSGVLTDRDIQLLATAGSNLSSFNMSENEYRNEVSRVISTMDRTINQNGLTPEQATFWGVLEPTDTDTFNSLWEAL
jgi:hypothetical protein